jgi:hypothetical protein
MESVLGRLAASLVVAVAGLGLFGLISWIHGSFVATAQPPPVLRADHAVEVNALRERLARVESQLVSVSKAAGTEQFEEPRNTSSNTATPPDISQGEIRRRLISHFSTALRSEKPDARRTDEFAAAIKTTLNEAGVDPSSLERVDCRETICQVVFAHHEGGLSRDSLDLVWGKEPLLHGGFDYLSENGSTIAYSGVAGQPLEMPSARLLPPSSSGGP